MRLMRCRNGIFFENERSVVPGTAPRMNPRLRTSLLFLPLLMQLCVFRMAEYVLMSGGAWVAEPDSSVLLRLIAEGAPGFLLIALLPTLTFVTVRTLSPGLRPWLAAVPSLAILLLYLVGSSISVFSPWLHPDAVRLLFTDALFVIFCGIGVFFLLEHTSGPSHKIAIACAHCFVGIASLLLTLNFGYFLTTGASGDWLLFWYALQTIHETGEVIASEISITEIVLLSLPVVIAGLPFVLGRVPRVRGWSPMGDADAKPWFWSTVAASVLALGLHSALGVGIPGTSRSLFGDIVRDVASVREHQPRHLVIEQTAFEAGRLRFRPSPEARRMNVVVLVLESVRADVLTPYDRQLPTTPFLDSLAAEGALVRTMYAPVAHTTKALVPILAGVYPSLQLQFPEARPGGLPATALPTLLAPLGYRSAFITPAPLAFENKDGLLLNMGFEFLQGDGSFDTRGFDRIGYFGYEDRVIVQPTMAWVDEVTATNQPFFLTVLTLTTHHPYNPPSSQPFETYHHRIPDPYLNAVAATDRFVRELFEEFVQRDLLDETIFVIVSDHGEAFREHGMTGHNQILWDEVLHVPAILFAPSLIESGTEVAGIRSQLDILPTIADLLGMRVEDGRLPGVSLLEEVPDDRILYHSAWNSRQGLALREGKTKYLFFPGRNAIHVFDTAADPAERVDIARSLPRDVLREAEMELVSWRWSVAACYP